MPRGIMDTLIICLPFHNMRVSHLKTARAQFEKIPSAEDIASVEPSLCIINSSHRFVMGKKLPIYMYNRKKQLHSFLIENKIKTRKYTKLTGQNWWLLNKNVHA